MCAEIGVRHAKIHMSGILRKLTSKKQAPGVAVTSNALKQGQSIADSVAGGGGQLTGIKKRVDADDLLEKTGHDTCIIRLVWKERRVIDLSSRASWNAARMMISRIKTYQKNATGSEPTQALVLSFY